MMKKYKIYAGLGGGFGGAEEVCVDFFPNEKYALCYAYDCAVEAYQGYEGLHGLVTYQDIYENPSEFGLEEDCCDETLIDEVYTEQIADWIEYYVEEVE
jgi:hypothetical protein